MVNKKAQGWGLDVMVGTIIFVTTISIFFLYSINFKAESDDILNSMQYDGDIAADIILSEGYPTTWNKNNVIVPGIITDKRVDKTKLINFSELDYEQSQTLLNTRHNFCFNFSEPFPVEITKSCIGDYDPNAENLIVISRIVIYNNKSSLFKLTIWD